jgi:hypothetical protein
MTKKKQAEVIMRHSIMAIAYLEDLWYAERLRQEEVTGLGPLGFPAGVFTIECMPRDYLDVYYE